MGSVPETRNVWKAGAVAAALALLATPVDAQAPDLAMLDSLTKGAWTLRMRDSGAQQQVCVHDGREFIQLRHRQSGCSRFVVQDGPEEVIVQYTCRGNGYGRTSIRREGNSLVQIRSQGFQGSSPFSFSAEARHSGSC